LQVNSDGELTGLSEGTATVKVWWETDPTVYTEIEVEVLPHQTIYMRQLTAGGTAGPATVRGLVNFVDGEEIKISHLSQEQIAKSYNRDFMSYDPVTETLLFTGPTGEYDVFYTEEFNYFFICKYNATYPETYWVTGTRITMNPDANMPRQDWNLNNIQSLGYMKNLGDGRYQVSLNMVTSGTSRAVVQIRIGRPNWQTNREPTLIGPAASDFYHDFATGGDQIFCNVPGYYRYIYNDNDNTLHIELIPNP